MSNPIASLEKIGHFCHYRKKITTVNYVDFTEDEVKEHINILREEGLIKPINDIFPGERRFDIADDSLKGLASDVWHIHSLDFNILIGRLMYKGKPIDEDKAYLQSVLGKRMADRSIAIAHQIRKSIREERKNMEKTKGKENIIKEFEETRETLINAITKKYKTIIKENEIARELIEGISISPSLSIANVSQPM